MTKTEPQIKRENDINDLIKECRVFFAFSPYQLTRGKEDINLKDGEKLVSIGMGGVMPSSNVQKYLDGMKKIKKEFEEAMQNETVRKEYIKYELRNHEAYYTGDIETTMEALGDTFTIDEVLTVLNER